MRLSDLRLHHARGLSGAEPPEAWSLETCQRTLVVDGSGGAVLDRDPSPWEIRRGTDAYELLLRIACGLESTVRGETEVFGQLKESWARYRCTGGQTAEQLEPWVRCLFEDAKEIRSLLLRNVGAASYGALVRKALRNVLPRSGSAVLLIGAGALARSVLPWIREVGEIRAWNRGEEALGRLLSEAAERPGPPVRAIGAGALGAELTRCAAAVVCIPAGTAGDTSWAAAWNRGPRDRALIHLGLAAADAGSAWDAAPGIVTLEDLHSRQRERNELNRSRFEAAEAECARRARWRALGGPPGLAHGWEDLAAIG